MKKLFLTLPTLLLLIAPASVLAHNSDNHGAAVSVVAKEKDDDHGARVSEVAKDNHGAQVVVNNDSRKHDDEDDENKTEENENHHKTATASANKDQQLKIKIKINGNLPGATVSATPSAQIKVSGPLDQVIHALEQIINFLKSLV